MAPAPLEPDCSSKKDFQRMRIDARQRDVRSDARHKKQRQRIEDAGAELGNLQGIRESRNTGGKFMIYDL